MFSKTRIKYDSRILFFKIYGFRIGKNKPSLAIFRFGV